MENEKSYFDGGLLGLVGRQILGFFMILFTIGLATPWVICMVYGWKVKHTVIEGKRLRFEGTGLGLLGNWIKWWFLTLITFGIYGFWVVIALEKWRVKHTYFAD